MKYLLIEKKTKSILGIYDAAPTSIAAPHELVEVEATVVEDFKTQRAADKISKFLWENGSIVKRENKIAPLMVSPAQLLLALLADGVTESMIRSAIDGIPDAQQKEAARIEFERRELFSIEHPVVISLAQVFGYETPQKLAALFLRASKL